MRMIASSGVVLVAVLALGRPGAAAAQVGWVPLQWPGPSDTWFTLEYDRATVRRAGTTWSMVLRRSPEEALRQEPPTVAGSHPWTRQEIELDCVDEVWRVVRWESRDGAGTLLASGGGATWSLIRADGYPRALERRLCPWP